MAGEVIAGPKMIKATAEATGTQAELVGVGRSTEMRCAGAREQQPVNAGGSAQVNAIGEPHP